MADGETGNAADDGGRVDPVRVFVSYAHDDAEHEDRVRDFWLFLRAHGIDARLDKPAAERRPDWPLWMLREVRGAKFVLVVASPADRQRAEGEAPADVGRGVQWEAALIREEVYADREAALNRFLPVVLPGCAARDIPIWLGRETATHYAISDYTVPGAEKLLRLLLGKPYETEPPLGTPPVLLPRNAGGSARRPGLRTELLINATGDGAGLVVEVALAGTPLGRRESTIAPELRTVWQSLRSGPLVAAERMPAAGRQLADLIGRLLATQKLLLVFDDFEQNLSRPGGETFLDPIVQDAITTLNRSCPVRGRHPHRDTASGPNRERSPAPALGALPGSVRYRGACGQPHHSGYESLPGLCRADTAGRRCLPPQAASSVPSMAAAPASGAPERDSMTSPDAVAPVPGLEEGLFAAEAIYREWGWPVILRREQVLLVLESEAVALLIPVGLSSGCAREALDTRRAGK